jgi:hypothetical protein
MAHVPRLDCRCQRCSRVAAPTVDAGQGAITTAGAAAEDVLTDLRRRQAARLGLEFSPELAIGNVVWLKRPYGGALRRPGRDRPLTHGIIAQQLHATGGVPVVSLWLYDDDGRLYLHGTSRVPVYVDLPASELVLHKVAAECGYRTVALDLYPSPEGGGP